MKTKKLTSCMFAALLICCLAVSGIMPNKSIETMANTPIIWSALATEKIRQDIDYAIDERGPAEINISLCRNEVEGANLIISPAKDVSNYDLKIADLKNENGDVISKTNVKLYNQHYIRTYQSSNGYFEPGMYPDAIIPFENAKNAGENKISGGTNQGIYLTVETHEETVAGTYTGTFSLTIDGTDYNIPVTVNVYDFAVPEDGWPKTLQTMWLNYLTQGEYESTIEMWEAYNDFFLDYGISCLEIPIEGTNIDSFLANLKKNYDRMTAYNIPYKNGFNWEQSVKTWSFGPMYEELAIVVRHLIKFSVEEGKDYLSKAYIYNFYIDEYTATGTFGDTRINTARLFGDGALKTFEEAIAYFDNIYGPDYIDSVEGLRESTLNIGLLSVCNDWLDGVTDKYPSLCLSIGGFTNLRNKFGDDFVEKLKNDPSNRNKETWWYTAIGSKYPNIPGYMIDDPSVDDRLMSWIQYKEGLAGHLYWCNNNYAGTLEYAFNPEDEWTVANRAGGGATWNGDGFLVYPGYNYGIKGPIGTLRLENIRDGMEEYKWLTLIDNAYASLAEYYEENVNSAALMETIYGGLFNVTTVNYDSKNFAYHRDSVAKAIISMLGDEKIAFLSASEDDMFYYADVIIDKKYSITSDNVVGEARLTSNGKGKIYSFKIGKNFEGEIYLDFTYTNGEETKTFEKYLGLGSKEVVSFTNIVDADLITISDKAGSSIVGIGEIDGRTGLRLNLTTYKGIQGLTKYPYFEFSPKDLLRLIPNPKAIYIDIYNSSEYDLPLVVYGTNVRIDEVMASVTLVSKSWTRVSITRLTNLGNVDSVKFALPNFATEMDVLDEVQIPIEMHDIYISRLAYVSK